MIKIYLDCEMTGLTKNDRLISIGAIYNDPISRKNKTFYAEFNDYDKNRLSDWIKENVIKNLKFNDKEFMKLESMHDVKIKSNSEYISEEFRKWIEKIKDDVIFVADVGHYDIVFTYELFGGAFSLPKNLSATYHDLNTDIANHLQISEIESFDICREDLVLEEITDVEKHNALYDTIVCKYISDRLEKSKMMLSTGF